MTARRVAMLPPPSGVDNTGAERYETHAFLARILQ